MVDNLYPCPLHPSDKSAPTMMHIIEGQMNTAILNQHKKGLSNRAIGKLFSMPHNTVARTIDGVVQKNRIG
ncbi:hypothetical protein D3C85_787180 [compost metagenome]